jgi:biotin/methionine sulfoxide reductase
MTRFRQHSSHWGTFQARPSADGLEIQPFAEDPAPSPLLGNIPAALTHPARLTQPLIRKGWLEDGPGPDRRRGADTYVAVDWETALSLAAKELARLGQGDTPGAHVFGGSYGWSSAGRFHHAQSQLHRFLNTVFGGYVGSVNTYSSAAGEVILSLVWGNGMRLTRDYPWLEEIAEEVDVLLTFGGIPLRNTQVSPGGISQHLTGEALARASARGARLVSVSPLADDFPDLQGVERLAPVPGTDTALMLALAYCLERDGAVDRAYLASHTTGYDRFLPYLMGADGTPKTPDWASAICDIPAARIEALAKDLAHRKVLVNIAYGLQRSEHGEQPVWMALTLAAMLGGRFSYGLGSIGNIGKATTMGALPTLPQGKNGITDFIPVARIADLLLHPGAPYRYKGETRTYADIRLVYWAGGNPFHHHQDLARLTEAFSRPETIILHDSVGTASAAHADIVFPATTTYERRDIGAAGNDPWILAMEPLAEPKGARDDFAIFADLARRLGHGEAFTEGLDADGWLRRLWGRPDWEDFLAQGRIPLPIRKSPGALQRFAADPARFPLETPSGRIEIFSETVEATGLPGHPVWLAPRVSAHPFQLISNQPASKLHSQLDFGPVSMKAKAGGREIARLNPTDAARLGVTSGEVLRLWNERGNALVVAEVSQAVRPGVVQMPTGSWYAPAVLPGIGLTCLNGNPNILTEDIGASDLSQGTTGQRTWISVERFADAPPPVPHEAILRRAAPHHDPKDRV